MQDVYAERTRPSFREIYMRLAHDLARRSTCSRLHVGCVITSDDYRHVIGLGYNGNARGGPNCCDTAEVGACGCVHAEDNAVINATASQLWRKVVFVTHLPCVLCAKRLINLGNVSALYYAQDYRIRDALTWLEQAGIPTHHMSTDGSTSADTTA